MANVSLAYGTLTVKKNTSKADISLVQKMFLETESFYYGNLSSVGEEIKDFDQEVSFGTDGKWMFIRNIEQFFEGISGTTLTNDELRQLEGIQILFNYSDFEPGEEYLVTGDVLIEAEYTDNCLETIVISEDIEERDVNAENLVGLGIFCEIFDTYTTYGINTLKGALDSLVTRNGVSSKCADIAHKILTKDTELLLEDFKRLNIYEYKDADDYDIDEFLLDYFDELQKIR